MVKFKFFWPAFNIFRMLETFFKVADGIGNNLKYFVRYDYFQQLCKYRRKTIHQIDNCVRSLQAKYNLSNSNKKVIKYFESVVSIKWWSQPDGPFCKRTLSEFLQFCNIANIMLHYLNIYVVHAHTMLTPRYLDNYSKVNLIKS